MERLEYETYAFGPKLRSAVFVKFREVRRVEDNVSAGRQVQPSQQSQQRRLARTGRSDHSNRFAGRYCETDVRKNGQSPFRAANLFAQAPGFENRVFI